MNQKRIIIIGASGLLGTALLDLMRRRGTPVIALFASHSIPFGVSFNALTQELCEVLPNLNSNDYVVFLAAYSNQAWVRNNPNVSRALNVTATLRIAKEVTSVGASFMFLSSEAVFGHDSENGWAEDTPLSPLTEYGRQKAEAERMVISLPRSCIVRTGWNVGWGKDYRCVVSDTYKRLLMPGAQMAFDNFFTLTDVLDTARSIAAISESGAQGIYHVASQPPICRSELANIIMDTSVRGSSMQYDIIDFKKLDFQEPRAAKAWLRVGSKSAIFAKSFRAPHDVIRAKVRLLDICG